MFKTATGVSAFLAAGAAATAFAMQQYGEDPTFRAKVRRDWPPSLVQWLEASLPDYMPQAAHAMRIDDEAADEPSNPSEPSDRRGASTRNLGFAPRPPEDLGTSRAGTPSLYSRFGGESATPEPNSAAVDSPASAVVPGVQWGQKGHPSENALSELGPVAPDDDEPDGAAQTDAWAHAAWPEQPTRLVVPVAAARRYEAALVNFSILRSALRGDTAALQLEHARLPTRRSRARRRGRGDPLDDAFRDDAYGTMLAEGADELATKPPLPATCGCGSGAGGVGGGRGGGARRAPRCARRRAARPRGRRRRDPPQRPPPAPAASSPRSPRRSAASRAPALRRVTDAEREAAAALPVTV